MNAEAVVELFLAERRRQVEGEGYAADHDVHHTNESLARAAAAYALPERSRQYKDLLGLPGMKARLVPWCWPWAFEFWKPTPDNRVRELVKAGALLIAEIERLSAVLPEPCAGNDPTCPCQDGDPCHYEDFSGTPAFSVLPEPEETPNA
jgi:hypothetical protein